MDEYLLSLSEKLLQQDEGFSSKPYVCTAGKLTIGFGRNIEDVGITKEEAAVLLRNDIIKSHNELDKAFSFYKNLSNERKYVLINMCVNIGLPKLSLFKRMIKALIFEDYVTAAKEMRDSKWYKQVGKRSKYLSDLMENI